MTKTIISAALFLLLVVQAGVSQSPAPAPKAPNVLASMSTGTITEEDVRAVASSELENLEDKRMQAEVSFNRDRQVIYERAISVLIEKRLVEAAASKQNMTAEAFVTSEVNRAAKMPTDEQVAAMLEQNKARTNMSPADAMNQIRTYLTQQARRAAYQELIERLRGEYKVNVLLEPLRTAIVTEGFPSEGPSSAPVTIVEFADFDCPFCAQVFPTLQQILKTYGDKVRLVYREFPLTDLHPHAEKAAEAALCARDQHKFWEMHDKMFQDRGDLQPSTLKAKAASLGLDSDAFNACLDSGKYAKAIAEEIRDGQRAGVSSTPTLFINGQYVNGARPYAEISRLIDEELRKKASAER